MSKYILGERIAQGGMAEIYLGKIVGSEGFTRLCAFKKILPHFASDIEFMDMFRNEAMLAKMLQNKNIVQVYDFESDFDQGPILVMEYVDGQDLRAILREAERARKPIPIELAVYMAAEALSGLAYAHASVDVTGASLGIIHRDVSPQNILVSFEGDVKITDFGIAKAQSSVGSTRTGVLKGKFRYMAPEQASGGDVDARCDLFAMGIVLYETLTMTRLFKGDDDLQVLQAVRECKIRSPNDVKGVKIPSELESIVFKLLAKDPLDRFQTGREASKELTRFLYSYRRDFFAGELSDYMQELFADKMQSVRDRMRSTLALPIDALRSTRVESPYSAGRDNSLGVFSIENSSPPQSGKAGPGGEFPKTPLGGTPVGNEQAISMHGSAGSNSEVMLDMSGRDAVVKKPGDPSRERWDPKDKSAQFANKLVEPSIQRKIRRTSQAAIKLERNLRRSRGNSSISVVRILLISLAIVAVLGGFGGILALRMRAVRIPTVVEFKSGIDSQKRVKAKVDGQNVRGGAWFDLPLQLSFEWGQHTVVFSKPGFRDQRIVVNAPLIGNTLFGDPKSELVLLGKESSVGNVLILTDPPGAKLSIDDGQFSGVSGKQIEFVTVGHRYRMKIEHPKCSTLTVELDIPASYAGDVYTKHYSLRGCR